MYYGEMIMVEMFLSAIPNVLSAIFVGSVAGGIVQVCDEDIPKLQRLESNLTKVMQEREVAENIQIAFWKAYDDTYNGPKLPSSCEQALWAVGTSKEELLNEIWKYKNDNNAERNN